MTTAPVPCMHTEKTCTVLGRAHPARRLVCRITVLQPTYNNPNAVGLCLMSPHVRCEACHALLCRKHCPPELLDQ